MTCSLIITTYNWEAALALVIESVFQQTHLPNEIIIADDGSTSKTQQLIKTLAKTSPLPIVHSWQEDKGFRASASRNKAIAKAKGEYIILIDGDMILHPHFIHDHLTLATSNHFLQGTRVLLTSHKSQQLLKHNNSCVTLFDRGLKNRKNALHAPFLTRCFSTPTTNLKGIKTCNISFFREDAIKINGFNEDFVGWGREDSEFALRLINNKILRKNIRFSAIAYHIYHKENPRQRLSINDTLLAKTKENALTSCEKGINQYVNQ